MREERRERKKIVHLQIPIDERSGIFLLDVETVIQFYRTVRDSLRDEYYVIVTPLLPSLTDYITNIDMSKFKDMKVEEWYPYIISEIEREEEERKDEKG